MLCSTGPEPVRTVQSFRFLILSLRRKSGINVSLSAFLTRFLVSTCVQRCVQRTVAELLGTRHWEASVRLGERRSYCAARYQKRVLRVWGFYV